MFKGKLQAFRDSLEISVFNVFICMQVLGGLLLYQKTQVHFHIFPKCALWFCSCPYSFWASFWTYSLCDTIFGTTLWKKNQPLSCLNSYILGSWTVISLMK